MKMDELIKAVAFAYKNPEACDADRNGNMRLVVLKERFHLSSLKVTKILVTAGVYEPVKANTPYEEITRLREAGRSAKEIIRMTGLSSACVSAYLPYERGVYHAERCGAAVSAAAARKRKQRSNEDRKMENARDMLRDHVTDGSFWNAVREHCGETFVRTDGVRYTVAIAPASAEQMGSGEPSAALRVETEKGEMLAFPQKDVFAVLHNALEMLAFGEGTEEIVFEQSACLPYVYPMLVYFGVIPGDARRCVVKRVDRSSRAEEKQSGDFTEGVRFKDRLGRIYPSDLRSFFFSERDWEGRKHFFACNVNELPGHIILDAFEVHRLTKAGRYARGYTGTDYELSSPLFDVDSEDKEETERRVRAGVLNMADRVRDALRNPSLEWHDGPPSIKNAVVIGNRQCTLRSVGEMQVVYVDEAFVQGRKWNGGEYGFRVDGIIFTEEEIALMTSAHEGWSLQYRFADPSEEPLRAGEYLLPVPLGEKELAAETAELLRMFAPDGRFISARDEENFGILFEKGILKKLKLYYENNPRGYGKLAGMRIVQQLECVAGTEWFAEMVRGVVVGWQR